MSTEDRLKEILARQAIAAEQRQASEVAAEQRRQEAAETKARIKSAWEARLVELEQHIEHINDAMGDKGQAVYLHSDTRDDNTAIANYTISFNQYRYPGSPGGNGLDNMRIRVSNDGATHFRVGNRHQSPVKQYDKNILECNSDDMLNAILDFMDANTPKAKG